MRIFVAGATGVIGSRLLPPLIAAGHQVAGMTRSPARAQTLRTVGVEPVVCDVFDGAALTAAVRAFAPETVIHQLTDLPDQLDQLQEYAERNDRIRIDGTRNLLAAAAAARAGRFLGQSIAWRPPGRGRVIEEHERLIRDQGGVVIRYGQLYGPGTFYPREPPLPPRVHVDRAAEATLELLDAQPGIVTVAEYETESRR